MTLRARQGPEAAPAVCGSYPRPMRVILDGEYVGDDEAAISVFDWAVQRGFGCFEVIRSYAGTPFRLEAHLERLARSAAALCMEPPDREAIGRWVESAAARGGDCLVRVLVTGGGRDPVVAAPPRTVVMWEPLPYVPTPIRLCSLVAAWHPGRAGGPLTGVKWLSYAPNMASSDVARRSGHDDALLLSGEGWVLEGPTFGIAWVADGVLETPTLELGLLASITRMVAVEGAGLIGLPVVEGTFPLERVLGADEVMVFSTVKEVTPVGAIDGSLLPAGPVTGRLLDAFLDIVSAETGHDPRRETG